MFLDGLWVYRYSNIFFLKRYLSYFLAFLDYLYKLGVLDPEIWPAHPDRWAGQLHQRGQVPAHPPRRLRRVEPQGLQSGYPGKGSRKNLFFFYGRAIKAPSLELNGRRNFCKLNWNFVLSSFSPWKFAGLKYYERLFLIFVQNKNEILRNFLVCVKSYASCSCFVFRCKGQHIEYWILDTRQKRLVSYHTNIQLSSLSMRVRYI